MTPLEKWGLAVLREKPANAPKRPYFVRIPYESSGGEKLAVDAGPMSRQAAEALSWKYRNSWMHDGKHVMRGDRWCRPTVEAFLPEYRVVKLPSQHDAPVLGPFIDAE